MNVYELYQQLTELVKANDVSLSTMDVKLRIALADFDVIDVQIVEGALVIYSGDEL